MLPTQHMTKLRPHSYDRALSPQVERAVASKIVASFPFSAPIVVNRLNNWLAAREAALIWLKCPKYERSSQRVAGGVRYWDLATCCIPRGSCFLG